MSLSPKIVMFGRDPSLLQTRRWVLEKALFQVRSGESLGEIDQLLDRESADVLILCHSLRSEDATNARATARRLQPAAKHLVLSLTLPTPALEPTDVVLSAFLDPRTLISTVREMTGQQPSLPPATPPLLNSAHRPV